MINYINKSSLNQLPRIILIDNAEYLNKNSLNSLLKIVEEPNYNVSFIFIHNSNKKLPDTLKSRCLLYKINLSFKKTVFVSGGRIPPGTASQVEMCGFGLIRSKSKSDPFNLDSDWIWICYFKWIWIWTWI